MHLSLISESHFETLLAERTSIIERWRKSVCQEVPALCNRPLALYSRAHTLLDRCLAILRDDDEALRSNEGLFTGLTERAHETNEYTLEQIILEYGIFRKTLIETLENVVRTKDVKWSSLHRFLDTGITQVALEFERRSSTIKIVRDFFARKQLQEVLMNAPFPLSVLKGADHLIGLTNQAQLSQCADVPAFGRPYAEVYPEFAPHVIPILDRVYREGLPVREREVKIGLKYYNCSYLPLRNEEGSIDGVIVSTVDVTGEVQGRNWTEDQKKWLEYVIDLIPVPTMLIEPGSGDIVLINAMAKRTAELYPDDPKIFAEDQYFFTDSDGQRINDRDSPRFRAARGDELYGLQLTWNTPTRRIPFVIESRRIPKAFGHPAVIAIHYQDITNLKTAESELRESISILQREREIRERFVSTLSHDLRNPLTAAKLAADLLAREFPNSEMIRILAGRLRSNLSRADHMIKDLLDANRLKAGEAVPIRVGEHCLNDVTQSSLDGLREIYGDRFVLISEKTIRGRWCRSSVKRMIENLCSNAIKYGTDSAPIEVELSTEARNDEEHVQILVRNLGNPIPREEQPGLFQPFHRTQTAESGEQKGWGLGLALVRGLAEAHGGSIALSYSDERGTEFCVDLPRITSLTPVSDTSSP